jgi:aryl-alcohol dehydrogenase-like predicted oxidoreductase
MRIGLGTAQFGEDYGITNAAGRVGRAEAAAIIALAAKSGIDTLDSAPLYGDSEAAIGEAGAAGFRIVTKTPKFGASSSEQAARAELRATFLRSLDKLGCDRVHGLLLHDPADLLGPIGPALWQEMEDLRAEGLVSRIGASMYEGEEIDRALDSYPLDLVQLPFSPLDQRLLDGGQLRRLSEAGVEVQARSLFLQGLLLAEPGQIPYRFAPVAAAMADLRAIFAEAGLTAVEGIVALAFERTEIDRFICGVTSAAELQAIIVAAVAAESGAAQLPDYAPPKLDDRLLNPARWDELA